MSKYTTEVRFICEVSAGLTESAGYNSIDSVLDNSRDKVFDFNFPIFDENYRITLENKILKHYYTREIGFETVGLWKHFLCTRLNEIMPYYNKLYNSALLEFNPFYDVDLTTDYQKVDNGNNNRSGSFSENGSFNEEDETSNNSTDTISSTTNNANKNDHWDYYSDTPQGGLNGISNNTYLTNARHVTDDGTGSTSTSQGTNQNVSTNTKEKNGNNTKSGSNNSNEVIKNVEDYLHHVVGKNGGKSYSILLEEYRKTFLNIDMMIINDLSDLFLNLW